MKKYLPHPLFFLAVAFCFALGKGAMVLYALAALLPHEAGHFFAARSRGFTPAKFTLTPLGATMAFDDGLGENDELFVAAMGPVVNLVICPLLLAAWWLFPSLYVVTKPLFYAHFLLAAYNLLPVFPLDGGRILTCLVKDKRRVRRLEKVIGFVLSALFFAGGIVAMVFGHGFSLLLTSILLFFCNLFPSKEEKYKLVFDQMQVFFRFPAERRDVYVSGDTPVRRLLRLLRKKNAFYVVHVYPASSLPFFSNRRDKPVVLCGEQLNALFFADRKRTLNEVLSIRQPDGLYLR